MDGNPNLTDQPVKKKEKSPTSKKRTALTKMFDTMSKNMGKSDFSLEEIEKIVTKQWPKKSVEKIGAVPIVAAIYSE